MKVNIFDRMFELYRTSYTHFENRAEEILIFLGEMGDCVKEESAHENISCSKEWYHFESGFARSCQERVREERGIILGFQKSRKKNIFPILLMEMYCFA